MSQSMSKDMLDIHTMSLEHIDQLIQQTWESLSSEEKKAFTDELHDVDQEYMTDIQTLIDQKFKE